MFLSFFRVFVFFFGNRRGLYFFFDFFKFFREGISYFLLWFDFVFVLYFIDRNFMYMKYLVLYNILYNDVLVLVFINLYKFKILL